MANHLTLDSPINNVNKTTNKSTLNRLRAGTILPGHHKLSLLKTISITFSHCYCFVCRALFTI